MKTHKFDVEDAEKYGIEKAILLEHLKFHQEANAGNDDMVIDGRVHAFIKPKTIKEMYPYMNYASVRRWLKELEEDGVIESCKPKARGGYHLKYYHVRKHSLPNDQNDQSNDQNAHSLNDQNDQSSIVTNVKSTNEEDIEEIYQLYPRHVGKKKALKKIEKALDDMEVGKLKEIVKKYAHAVKDKDKQYIPYPATWFNQGRYLDDPDEWVDYKEENSTGLGDNSKLRRVNI